MKIILPTLFLIVLVSLVKSSKVDPLNNNSIPNNPTPNSNPNSGNQGNSLQSTNPEECKKRKIDVITMRLAIVEYSVQCIYLGKNIKIPNSPPNISKEEFIKAVSDFLSKATIEQLTSIRDEMDKNIENGVLKFAELGSFSYNNNVLTYQPNNNSNNPVQASQPTAPSQPKAATTKQRKKSQKLRTETANQTQSQAQTQTQSQTETQVQVQTQSQTQTQTDTTLTEANATQNLQGASLTNELVEASQPQDLEIQQTI